MSDLRFLSDEASDDESTSKLVCLDPELGTDRLDVECSAVAASSV